MKCNEMYKLSICIPTYNRPEQFERLMKQLASQILDEVELVVRDDSENELTQNVFEKYFDISRRNINYVRGKKLGLDSAMLYLLEHAKGNHIWYFADDDEITEGAVNHVLNLLSKHEIHYSWINFSYDVGKTAIPCEGDRYFVDNNEVLALTGRSIGLLTTILIKRSVAIPFLNIAKSHTYGFAFAILIPVFGVLKENKHLYLISTPLIINNPTQIDEIKVLTNKNGIIKNDGFYVYGIYLKMVVEMFSDCFNKNSIKSYLKKNYRQTWMGMVVGYCGEFDTPQGKKIEMLKHYWMFPETILAIILLSFPRKLLNFLYVNYKRIREYST